MEKKITEYTIVEGTQSEVTQEVNELIGRGWEPLGGVAPVAETKLYTQAMVFKTADKN